MLWATAANVREAPRAAGRLSTVTRRSMLSTRASVAMRPVLAENAVDGGVDPGMTLDRDRVARALPSYEIGEEVGRGAWGVVIRAKHRQLGREVAIKELPRRSPLTRPCSGGS